MMGGVQMAGRPKKAKDNNTLSEQEVWDVISFAREMYNMYPGVYNPDIVNSRLKDITLNPLNGTAEQIDQALSNPKNSEDQLRRFSHFFENVDMLYKRQILYLGNLLSFDLSWTFTNVNKASEYNSPAFKKDEKILHDFLDKFDVKAEFKKITRQLFRQEVCYTSFRDEGDKYVLQELDPERCKITGRFEYGLLFDFDMQYFMISGNSLDMYHSSFKKYWDRIMDQRGSNNYIPSRTLDERTGQWSYWVMTSPEDNCWAFKLNPEIGTKIPFFAPLFPELVNKPLIRNLQKSKYIAEASKLLVGFIGFNKDNKSGSQKDSLNITVETAGRFANLIRSALEKDIKFGITPFEDIKQYEWESGDVNIYDQYNKVTVSQSGTNTKLLYNSDKANVVETKNSIALDEHVVEYTYSMFENFLEYYINKKLKTYKVKFKFEGTEMPDNKDKRLNDAMSMMNLGVVLPHKIANALSMQYQDLDRQLTYAKATGFIDKLMPIISAYQQSSKDVENGRPEKKSSDLTDSGAETKGQGSNVEKE